MKDLFRDFLEDDGGIEDLIGVSGDNHDFSGKIIENFKLGGAIAESVNVVASASGVLDLDLSLGHNFTITLAENITSLTFSNVPAVSWVSLAATQHASSAKTFAFPASTIWVGGAPTFSVGVGDKDLYTFITLDGGTTWFSFSHLNFVV